MYFAKYSLSLCPDMDAESKIREFEDEMQEIINTYTYAYSGEEI